ncbi:methionine adenosyltransferase [Candidatus Gottesmanbacteria bacterium]|nr:methionine adenosyltransferase [Candidatus Gottesmanbacteria bacterium]
MNYQYFTSESVASGHPDKICDQVSDAVVDAALKIYPGSRVAVETLVTKDRLVMAGEVTCPQNLPFEEIARKVIKDLGYINEIYNFSYKSPMSFYIHEQSPDISRGVDTGGAGDQGMMFGFASTETPELMPLPIILAHRIVEQVDKLKKTKLKYLRPDGKSEVKIRYEKGIPKLIEKIIIAVPHNPDVSIMEVKKDLIHFVIKPIIKQYKLNLPKMKDIILNGTGRWEIGGPAADTGVTGRKIIVDSYGAMARHGGGAFSGKDPTKVDRSGAYAARFLAKNIVAAKMADRAEVQIAYVIGQIEPIAKAIETFGTQKVDKKKIEKFAWSLLDLSVPGIIRGLKLNRPIYQKTACYGHFGRNEFPWEKVIH